MLDAGPLALIVRAGAGVQHHRRRGRLAPRHLRLELPGQERRRRRRAGLRTHAGARPPHPRQRGRPARGTVEQEGVLQGARAARTHARPARVRQHRPGVARRAQAFGMRCGLEPPLRHRRGRAAARLEAFGRSRSSTRPKRRSPAPTSSACTLRSAPRPAGSSTPRCCRTPGRAPSSSTPPAVRWWTHDRARGGRAPRASAWRSTCFANEPTTATGAFTDPLLAAAERLRHPPHRRLHRAGAGSHRRRNRPHRPHLQGDRARAERGQPGAERRRPRTCSWCATATGPACWRTSSSSCGRRT
jgi:hypothetical protein